MGEQMEPVSSTEKAEAAYKRRKEAEKSETRWVFVETTHPAKRPVNCGSSSRKDGKDRAVGPLGFYELNKVEIQKLTAQRHLCRYVVLPDGLTPKDVDVQKISESVSVLSENQARDTAAKLVANAEPASKEKAPSK